ncbi:MAG: AmmeMemoRadiSam system protein A [Spirochaetia bacterium]|nr:AmmeMemoRadiSam system protein A [Spirochaetia bacterium]
MSLSEIQKRALLNLAKDSVLYGLKERKRLKIDVKKYTGVLSENRASFVTIRKEKKLCGCIGSIEARRPLVLDVVNNAYSAAFNDYRFSPVTMQDFNMLDFHISILGPLEEIIFNTEEELIRQVQPIIHGILIEAENKKATFLPSVWESLPDINDFLKELKKKAGLSENFDNLKLKVFRYIVEEIP